MEKFTFKGHGDVKRCTECCAATGFKSTRSIASISAAGILEAAFDPKSPTIFAAGAYGRISGSGNISMSWSHCGGTSKGGCSTISGEYGYMFKLSGTPIEGGARAGATIRLTFCGCCSDSGCGITVQICAGGRVRIWAKKVYNIWPFGEKKWESHYQWEFAGCSRAFNIYVNCVRNIVKDLGGE